MVTLQTDKDSGCFLHCGYVIYAVFCLVALYTILRYVSPIGRLAMVSQPLYGIHPIQGCVKCPLRKRVGSVYSIWQKLDKIILTMFLLMYNHLKIRIVMSLLP